MRSSVSPAMSWQASILSGLSIGRAIFAPFNISMLIALMYLLAAQILAQSRGDVLSLNVLGYVKLIGSIVPVLITGWVIAQFFHMIIVEKPESPLRACGSRLREMLLDRRRWANAIPFLSVIMLMSTAFSYFKSSVPYFQPFVWDQTFDRLDLWLHGGVRPWQLLQPVLGHPLISFAVNVGYNLWFFVMIGVWLWLAFTLNERAARQQFLLAFLLTWMVGGSLLAIALSSAGPCFFDKFVQGPNPYESLMEYLRFADAQYLPIWALGTQDMLWQGYLDPTGKLSGISAMPSMHVATASLFVPTARRIGPRLGWAALGFWSLIMIGSVHLGWHYAVDGYLAVAIAACAWWVAGKLVTEGQSPLA